MKIWRDDDIGFHLSPIQIERFKKIHSVFNKHKVTHTIAVVAKDIDSPKARPLVNYIKKQKNIDVQLHCWVHERVTPQEFRIYLPQAIEKMIKVFGKRPTIYYPPWNEVSRGINAICAENNIKADYSKISLSEYLQGMKGETINFHYWSDECDQLEEAIIKSLK